MTSARFREPVGALRRGLLCVDPGVFWRCRVNPDAAPLSWRGHALLPAGVRALIPP